MFLDGGDHGATRIDISRPDRHKWWVGWMYGPRANGSRINRLRICAHVVWTGLAGLADGIGTALDNSAGFISFFNTNIRDNSKTRLQDSHREGQRNLSTDQCEGKINLHCEDLLQILNDVEFVLYWRHNFLTSETVGELMRGSGPRCGVYIHFFVGKNCTPRQAASINK
jgi:hypothetical protein